MNVDDLICRLAEIVRSGHGTANVYAFGLDVVDLTLLDDGTVSLWTIASRPEPGDVELDKPDSGGVLVADDGGNVISLAARRIASAVFSVAEPGDFVLMEIRRATDAGPATLWSTGIVRATDGKGLMTTAAVFDACQQEWVEHGPINTVYIMPAAMIDVEQACRRLVPSPDRLELANASVEFLTDDGKAAVARLMAVR